ncbi:MAG: slipin family protein [Chloroflexi bacterium]|nr:slipin family protein [Chloroflexota bacterium]MBU1746591.1 slipin family protein [Chloroflexota bacterium]MBU1877678.1 slipin family protein [Chloroflexota bacterium]
MPETYDEPEFHIRIVNPISVLMALVVGGIGLVVGLLVGDWRWGAPLYVAAAYLLFAFKVASQWEKAVLLRLGRFRRVAGPGPFWVIPLVDRVAAWIDHRMMVSPFGAEKTLTRDTVPLDVDAVLFWVVWDATKAALEVKDYRMAISWTAQTALRDIIGKMDLADILVGRENIDAELQEIIDHRTTSWGITIESVEIRDITIPLALEDAMSRQAQAERERQARRILGQAEREVAEDFLKAAARYEGSPTAFQLRSLSIIMAGVKEHGSLVVVPYEGLHNLGGVTSLTGLAQPKQPTGSPED